MLVRRLEQPTGGRRPISLGCPLGPLIGTAGTDRQGVLGAMPGSVAHGPSHRGRRGARPAIGVLRNTLAAPAFRSWATCAATLRQSVETRA